MGDLRRRYALWTSMAVHAVQEVLRDDCLGIALYGSVARETPHDGSDIDLLCVARNLPSGRSPRAAITERIESAFRASAGPARGRRPLRLGLSGWAGRGPGVRAGRPCGPSCARGVTSARRAAVPGNRRGGG